MKNIMALTIAGFLFLSIFIGKGISLAALLTLGDRSYCPGTLDAYLPVDIITETGENVAAVNFDISYDTNQLIFKEVVASRSALDAEKNVYSSTPFPGIIRIVVSGLNQNTISDGTISNIIFNVPPIASMGELTLTFSNTVASDPNANHIAMNTISGSITIGNEMSVEMDIMEGYCMISLLAIPENALVAELFPEAVVVYAYEKEFGYVRVTEEDEMEAGKGYWILFNEPQRHILTGRPVNDYDISVSENGWYMIGGCVSQAQASSENCKIDVIYRYVPGAGYQRVLESENLHPGKGYWIKVNDIEDLANISVEKVY